MDESFPKYGIHKTSGLWWEPGAFQVFVNLALAFSLIKEKTGWEPKVVLEDWIKEIVSLKKFSDV